MNLKNYTSTVSVDNSIARIKHRLVAVGANHISESYDKETRQLTGMMFQIELRSVPITFKLPVHLDEIYNVMMREIRKPRPGTEERIRQQASRTAWKLLSDWVDIQASMIMLQQADFAEVFLPYIWIPGKDQTFYSQLKDSGFKQLTSGEGK